MAELLILPAIYLGIVIGLYEAILVHRDVSVPAHRFGHMLHALIFALVAVFATMNVEFVFASIPALANIPLIGSPLIFRIAIGIIAMLKIHAISAAAPGMAGGSVGLKEKWSHSFIVAVLIVAAPYVWPFIEPVVGFLPGI
ncbi:hypothetical protein HOF78_00345 [Candidatus Woesearchaeota archaeon]|jgi:hypothetical protein|nr:hypothetical protein [Candidatus Woesearchaeota archaeon]MBT6044584.1 hypothetical protein [Candidatus Woesearchaeota archaeon]